MSLDYNNPEKYIGKFEKCHIGYSNSKDIRENAASGGIVTTLLLYLLEKGHIQGAFVSKQSMVDGKVSAKSFIATSSEEILDCMTSIYVEFPLAKYFKEMLDFEGRLAIVALPCHLEALEKYIAIHPELKEKIFMKIALFCSGTPSPELIGKVLLKNGIEPSDVDRIYFRKGHWRGRTHVTLKDGTDKSFSYLYNICTYRNLYFHFLTRCFSCSNHFGYASDISCGDVWLKEMKSNPIKHTGFITKNIKALNIINSMTAEGFLTASAIPVDKVLKSQKRALIFKFNTAHPRKKLGNLLDVHYNGIVDDKYKINHLMASLLILLNIKACESKLLGRLVFMAPRRVLFLYMGLIRVLLNS